MAHHSILLTLACLLATVFTEWAPEMENDGLFEGDMILSPEQMNAAKQGKLSYALKTGSVWPGNVVYYTYAPAIAREPTATATIQAAISEYHAKTCIRFQKGSSGGHLVFDMGEGCSSYVGYSGGRMKVTLAKGCWRTGIVIHEIGHALGMYHEQSRKDRDQYLRIIKENIKPSMMFNFNIQYNTDSLNFKYDYDSVMHYGKSAFARSKGLVTIETTDRNKQNSIGGKSGLSSGDVLQLRKLYKCDGTGPNPPTRMPPTRGPGGGCKDDNPSCPHWKSLCTSHSNIRSLCKRSCNAC